MKNPTEKTNNVLLHTISWPGEQPLYGNTFKPLLMKFMPTHGLARIALHAPLPAPVGYR